MITKPNKIPSSLEEDFPIGLVVENFGLQAKVVGYLASDLIVSDGRCKWIADPDKCIVRPQRAVQA